MAVGATANITITGLKPLQKKMRRWPDKLRKRVNGQATKAAVNPIARAIRKAAPVGPTGNLKGSIATKMKRYQGGDWFEAIVGPRVPDKKRPRARTGKAVNDMGAHGHLIEFGTVRQPPRPFVRPVWDRMKDGLLDEFRKQLAKRVEKELAKR